MAAGFEGSPHPPPLVPAWSANLNTGKELPTVQLRLASTKVFLLAIFAAACSLPLAATTPPLPVIYDAQLNMTLSGAIQSNDISILGAIHNATGEANVLIVGNDVLVTGLTVTFDVDILNAAGTQVVGSRHFYTVFDIAAGQGIVQPDLNSLFGGSFFQVFPDATVYIKGSKAVRTIPGLNTFGYIGPPTQPGGPPSMTKFYQVEFIVTTSAFGKPATLDVQLST
jgi:hypothetical protein